MALEPNSRQCFGLGTQSNTCYSTDTILNVPMRIAVWYRMLFLYMFVS